MMLSVVRLAIMICCNSVNQSRGLPTNKASFFLPIAKCFACFCSCSFWLQQCNSKNNSWCPECPGLDDVTPFPLGRKINKTLSLLPSLADFGWWHMMRCSSVFIGFTWIFVRAARLQECLPEPSPNGLFLKSLVAAQPVLTHAVHLSCSTKSRPWFCRDH